MVLPWASLQVRVSWMITPPLESTASWRMISWSIARRTKRNELMFLSSVRVPNFSCPTGLIETFASQRNEPSSRFPSFTPMNIRMSRSFLRYASASSELRMSGSLTISMSGVPPRL